MRHTAILGLMALACALPAHAAPDDSGSAPTGLAAEDAEAAAVAVAPRVTLESIQAKIVREQTHVFDDVLTVHVLTMANGFTVTGESACASPANFNAELGQKIARDNAIRKVWGLEGYLLKERLHFEKDGGSPV